MLVRTPWHNIHVDTRVQIVQDFKNDISDSPRLPSRSMTLSTDLFNTSSTSESPPLPSCSKNAWNPYLRIHSHGGCSTASSVPSCQQLDAWRKNQQEVFVRLHYCHYFQMLLLANQQLVSQVDLKHSIPQKQGRLHRKLDKRLSDREWPRR